MAYSFSTGNTPASGPIAIYLLISTLITAGWTKVSDSDGTTYSAVGTQVTSGNGGAGGLGNNYAWVRMQAPTVGSNTREITFQRAFGTPSATFDQQWRVKYSANAGFIGGSPGTIQTPSATDEVIMLGGATDAAPTFNNWFTTNGAYRWHVACGGATELYSFIAFAMQNTTTTGLCGIFLDIMKAGTYPATDVDPAVMGTFPSPWISGNQPGFGPPNTNFTNPSYARAWLGPIVPAGSSQTSNNVNVGITQYGSVGFANSFAVNPFSGHDTLWSPIWIAATGNRSPIGYKGYSTLFYIGSVLRTTMDTCTTVGAQDRVFFGTTWCPWDGSTPTL